MSRKEDKPLKHYLIKSRNGNVELDTDATQFKTIENLLRILIRYYRKHKPSEFEQFAEMIAEYCASSAEDGDMREYRIKYEDVTVTLQTGYMKDESIQDILFCLFDYYKRQGQLDFWVDCINQAAQHVKKLEQQNDQQKETNISAIALARQYEHLEPEQQNEQQG